MSAVVLAGVAVAGCGGGGSSSGSAHGASVLVARVAPRALAAPLSRAVVLASHGRLLVLGGLGPGDRSLIDVRRVDPATGASRPAGSLARATHDAAGAIVGGRAVVFGGGAAASSATVQSFSGAGAARAIGRLPRPRSDLAAATVGGQVLLVGGYDGATPARSVLATTDGTRFRRVARLAAPVRYPAVAPVGGRLYVFGGLRADGHATSTIQEVDPRAGTSRVVGRLPVALSHATAATLGGRIYVMGGRVAGVATDRIWRYDAGHRATSAAGHLPLPVSDAGAARVGDAIYLVGGEDAGPTRTVVGLRLASPGAARARAAFGGRLLIADRGNDRLLLVDAAKRIHWRYPSPSRPAPPGGFYFPDDAFFIRHGTGIISNEEENHTIVEIGFPSGRLQWSYGHPHHPGSAPGYLNQPDDAYLLENGNVTVADALNCRILIIDRHRHPIRQIGTNGRCVHDPPRGVGYPNGDTPLANGNLLISEINGSYVSEYTRTGHLVWSAKLPIAYPSDPQQLGPDRYLVADYHRPGGIYEFNRAGRILWSYHPAHGPSMLDHPSLAERLPNGLIGVNDDYRHRVVLIDPHSRQIVWQYGVNDRKGKGPGRLNTPDGFDLLQAHGSTPTHPQTG